MQKEEEGDNAMPSVRICWEHKQFVSTSSPGLCWRLPTTGCESLGRILLWATPRRRCVLKDDKMLMIIIMRMLKHLVLRRELMREGERPCRNLTSSIPQTFQIRYTLNLNADNDRCGCAEALKERNFNKLELWRSMCSKKKKWQGDVQGVNVL